MKIIRKLSEKLPASAITIGKLDCLHLAHQKLIKKLVDDAQEKKLASVIISFYPHPNNYFAQKYNTNKDNNYVNIIDFQQRIAILRKFKVNYLILLHFNEEMAKLEAHDFIQNILIKKCNMKHIVIGDDFKFGYKREGDKNLLRKLANNYSYSYHEMPSYFLHNTRVSSSNIRLILAKNNIELVNSLLNRTWSIRGRVCKGSGRGSKLLSIPTANLNLTNYPCSGVFIVTISYDKYENLPAVANWGTRPTFDNNVKKILEIHLLNHNHNLYNKILQVNFLKNIRNEKKFSSLDELKTQITKDIQIAREFFYVS